MPIETTGCKKHRPIINDECRNCYQWMLRRRNPELAERQRENCRKWTEKNKDRCRDNIREWSKKHKEKVSKMKRDNQLKRVFGITEEDVENILKAQEYRCAICKKEARLEKRRLHVDHNHTTKVIRGLLCFRCNFGLGWFQDNADRFQTAADYLKGNNIGMLPRTPPVKTKRGTSSRIHTGFHRKTKD